MNHVTAISEPRVARIIPDTSADGHTFEYGIFGVNVEITRKGAFSGLCAQMLNNRKLFMGDQGVDGWVCHQFERILNRPEESLCQSNFVILKNGSMTQTADMITLRTGKTYEAKAWVKAITDTAEITFGVQGLEQTFSVTADGSDYTELGFTFAGVDLDGTSFSLSVHGEAAVYELSLLPADHFHGMRRDVIRDLRAMNFPAVRYPGGCYADHFEWKESLKAPEFRKPVDGRSKGFMLRNSYHQDCVEIGLNEFILLCREIGAEPEYTVSHLQSDGEDARRLIEYCNGDASTEYGALREALGYPPFHIKVWYIGNESYYSGGPYRWDGGLAGERTNEIVHAMRTVDPHIQAVIGLVPDHHLRPWSKAFMERLDCPYEFVSLHWYYGTGPTSEPNGVEACAKMKNTYLHDTDDGLEFYKNELLADVWDQTKICVDEWNFCWGSASNNALLTSNALQIHFFARNAEKYHIREARFFMPVNEGILTVTPSGSKIESSGELIRLMSHHRNGRVIPCSADNEQVDILCTDHGDHLFVSVINRAEEPYKLTVEGYDVCDGTEIQIHDYSFSSNDYTIRAVQNTVVSGYGILFITLRPTAS